MIELKIEDVIKILPFEDAFKVYMLETLKKLDLEQKVSVERILWDLYDVIFTFKYEENLIQAKAQMAVSNPQQELTEAFYSTIREQTQKQLLSEAVPKEAYVGLELTRHKLQQVIGEKQGGS